MASHQSSGPKGKARMGEVRSLALPAGAASRSNFWITVYAARPFALIALAIGSALLLPPWLGLPAALLLLLAAQRGFQALVHDASHFFYSAVPKRNDRLANWLAAGFIGMDVLAYRKVHLQHHAHNGSEHDPEHTSMATVRAEGGLGLIVMRYALGMEVLRLVRKYFFQPVARARPRKSGALARIPAMSHIVAAQAVLAGTTFAAGAWWLYPMWLYLAVSWNPLLSRLRFLVEHPGDGDATVTTCAGMIETALFAPHDFNYHCEHHGWPLVPPYRLPAIHRYLRDEMHFFDGRPEFVAQSFVGSLAGQLREGRAHLQLERKAEIG